MSGSLTVWAGLGVLLPFPSPPPPPPACQPVWQSSPHHTSAQATNPPPPPLGLLLVRECQPVRAFPLVGRTHRHTAPLSLLAKFLSCFVFLPSSPSPPHFLTLASFMPPPPLSPSAGSALFVSCPGFLNGLFISLPF